GLALLFDLLAFDFLESYLARKSLWPLVGFWIWCILSLISHLMFVMVYGAFVLWTAVSFAHERRGVLRLLAGLAICHGVPLAAVALFYFISIRGMVVGSAPPSSASEV